MMNVERLRQWLSTYPDWNGTLKVDSMDDAPGSAGLFPAGMEVTRQQRDLLGNRRISCRCRFTLYRRANLGIDSALWLLAFQQWVQQQSAMGAAPSFGDVPEQEQIQALKGSLKEVSRQGAGIYTVTLQVDFAKQYLA